MAQKILIVDDDVDSLKLIGLMLQRHGYEVVYANAGGQALQKANADIPDLIILDVMMPDMNGYEVCRRLRGNPKTQDIPIIMFTAKTLIDDKVAGFEAGADDYLTKPTHPAELASRVKSILQRNTKKRPTASNQGMTIGVIGSKGGIGTTTIALNLAVAFKQMDDNPVIADFRPGAGSLSLLMGQMKKASGMANALGKEATQIDAGFLQQELLNHKSGVLALLSSIRPRESLMKLSTDSAVAIVRGLKSIGNPAVFDLGAGLTPLNSRLVSEMTRLIIVVEPVGPSLSMARELLSELKKLDKVDIYVVVINRNQSAAQPAWHEVEQLLEHEILGIISAAPELAYQATEAGSPIVTFQPNAIVSNQFMKLAEDLKATAEPVTDGEILN